MLVELGARVDVSRLRREWVAWVPRSRVQNEGREQQHRVSKRETQRETGRERVGKKEKGPARDLDSVEEQLGDTGGLAVDKVGLE